MTITEVVCQIASDIVVGESPDEILVCFYGNDAEKNLEGDNGVFPCVLMDHPTRGEFELMQSGYLEETSLITLLFADKIKFDATPAQHELIINEQKAIAKQFITKLQNHVAVRSITRITGEGFTGVFDANLSGYMLDLSIVLFNDDSNCDV